MSTVQTAREQLAAALPAFDTACAALVTAGNGVAGALEALQQARAAAGLPPTAKPELMQMLERALPTETLLRWGIRLVPGSSARAVDLLIHLAGPEETP